MHSPSANPRKSATRGTRALTLIELLVVIAIVAILAAIALPALQNFQRKSGFSTSVGRMRAIATAVNTYAADNDGRLPVLHRNWSVPTTWVHQIAPYLGVTNVDLDRKPFTDPLERTHHPRLGDLAANSQVLRPAPNGEGGLRLVAVQRPSEAILVSMGQEKNGGGWRGTWYFYGDQFASNPAGDHTAQPRDRETGRIAFVHLDGSSRTMDWDEFLEQAQELFADPLEPQ